MTENEVRLAPLDGNISGDGTASFKQLAALFRELRAEVNDLQSVLDLIQKGESQVEGFAAYIEKTVKDVEALTAAMDAARKSNPDLMQDQSDTLRHIQNLWEQMKSNRLLMKPAECADCTAQEQLFLLNALEKQIKEMVYWIGVITIPSRLNEWLEKGEAGYYVPFNLVFEDEVPSPEDREKIFKFITYAPQEIENGIVDIGAGVIYKIHAKPEERWRSILLAAGTFLLSGAAVIGFANFTAPPLAEGQVRAFFNPASLQALGGWAAVLVGVLVHGIIGSAKRAREQGGLPSIIAVGRLGKFIDAKLGLILRKLALALIAWAGVQMAPGVEQINLFNTFLVGYSLDSFVELFSSSIEQQSAAQLARMKEQLGLKKSD